MVSSESIHLEVYDTTLRDGAQAEDVSFSVDDKIRIAKNLMNWVFTSLKVVGLGLILETLNFFR